MQLKKELVNFGYDTVYAMDITFTLDEISCMVFSLETEYKKTDGDESYKTRVKKLHNKLNYLLFHEGDECE